MITLSQLALTAATAVTAENPADKPWTPHDTQVLIVAVIGIAIVVTLIVVVKFHAFLALTIAAVFVGIASGIPLDKVTTSYETGVGGVLGYVGVLIGLGAMLGKLLADSGGADRVVDTILRGRPATLPWKMALIAATIGIPALAGLSVLHGFIPPHPGPLAAIGILNANVGITLAFGLLVAIPAVIVAGPLFGMLAARWVPIGAAGAGLAVTGASGDGSGSSNARSSDARDDGKSARDPDATRTPSFAITLVTLLSPLVLMLAKAGADIWIASGSPVRVVMDLIGDPVFALLFAVLLAMVTFGLRVGFNASVLSKKIGASLLPIVGVLFIVGAGGGFKQVLVDGGTGTAIAKIAIATGLTAIALGWIVAALIRLATGSATVATVTAAGIVAPLSTDLSPIHLALLVLAIGAGSLIFSHVNDAGFWLVKEYFGLTVGQTLKTWSVMETIISLVGLAVTLLLSAFLA